MGQGIGQGGFLFPDVYKESKDKVVAALHRGELDLVTFSRWHLADEFFAYVLGSKFLEYADKTYPNPRKKNEVPVWFQVSCQLLLHSLGYVSYKALDALLSAGPILTRVGFNVVAPIGFNDKNEYERTTPVHQDAVRKFFKDTDPLSMRRWFSTDLQRWFRTQSMYDSQGVYILDQTRVVVPDNPNYQDAVRMPVDGHGQLYKNYYELSAEQKKALPHHPCYTLSTLLHLNFKKEVFHFAGYEWGAGNVDELPQAFKIIDTFFRHNDPGTMKLLIVDRGYVCGKFITYVKTTYKVDVLVPLKTSMIQYQDALALAKIDNAPWVTVHERGSLISDPSRSVRACTIEKIDLWDECKVPLYTTVIEDIRLDDEHENFVTRYFVLVSTRRFETPHAVIKSYSLRSKTEECFRQLKLAWNLASFPSPDRSLIETHVNFTLITFCLFQLFLSMEQNSRATKRMITSLEREHVTLKDALVIYANGYFGVFGSKEYFQLISDLSEDARRKISANLAKLPNQF